MKPSKLAVFACALLMACGSSAPPSAAAPEPEPAATQPSSVEAHPEPGPEPTESITPPEAEQGSGAGALTWTTRETDPAVKSEWRACSASSECVLVEIACCDHCNGGKAVAVNESHIKDAEQLRPSCGNTMCTRRACMTRAACEDGVCVLKAPFAGP